MRVSGGGGKSAFWRQVLASILEKPIVSLETQEGSAYGAALLALVGTGAYASVPEICRSVIRKTGSIAPRAGESEFYQNGHTVYRAIYPALKPVTQMISRL